MHRVIADHLESIKALCAKHEVQRLSIFGSAVHGRFDEATSDADFVVEFKPFPRRGLNDPYFLLQQDLEDLLGRPVDLVEAKTISSPGFQRDIDTSRELIYAA